MLTRIFLYEAILYLYALSLLFYFSDFLKRNRSAKRIGAGLLLFVWVLQSVYMLEGFTRHGFLAAIPMEETVLLFSWLLVGVSLIIDRLFRIELFVFLINVLGLAALALDMFGGRDAALEIGGWNVSGGLLLIHISLAVGSYAAFAAGAVFSGMYLYLHRRLKEKTWSSALMRLPSLEIAERYAYRSVMIGVPLLISALSLGTVWVLLQGDVAQLADAKVLASWLTLAMYLSYLYVMASSRWDGPRRSYWGIAAFGVMLISLVVSSLFSNFHQWVWM
ncbi:cytochrome c biogenesis protein CcsA [Gorillibacterium massiliense]|uniref:cytochrome c biogenesis protein CcsA n=1 Tax=Gorillibacterium massiliense TaxID=1280390 RepID=UPI0004AF5C29|nr:cytochrome c biogenesis protein CcsA [Gorillibacterium massiliense]